MREIEKRELFFGLSSNAEQFLIREESECCDSTTNIYSNIYPMSIGIFRSRLIVRRLKSLKMLSAATVTIMGSSASSDSQDLHSYTWEIALYFT
jgi:hypothetical protein